MLFIYDYYLTPYTQVDSILIDQIIVHAKYSLQLFGFELLEPNPIYQYHLGIKDTTGVVVGNPCDGLSLFILFSSFVIVFKGKWLFKLLFIVSGIILIHILNVIRITALAIIVKYYPESLDFHHSYTFTLFVYSIIFLLWMIRIKIYQKKKW